MECVTGPLGTAGLRPWETSSEVSGMGQTRQTARCSWRHIVSWRNQDTGTVWVTWLGLGHEAIVRMGRKYNCKSKNCKNAHKVGFNMGNVHAKGHVLERLYRRRRLPSQPRWFSISKWREQCLCPKSEPSPRYQPTQIWSSQPLKQDNWHDLSWFYWLSFWK